MPDASVAEADLCEADHLSDLQINQTNRGCRERPPRFVTLLGRVANPRRRWQAFDETPAVPQTFARSDHSSALNALPPLPSAAVGLFEPTRLASANPPLRWAADPDVTSRARAEERATGWERAVTSPGASEPSLDNKTQRDSLLFRTDPVEIINELCGRIPTRAQNNQNDRI
ncbi:hypothetical protein MRX96_054368 [Rhipicephalus microplus]